MMAFMMPLRGNAGESAGILTVRMSEKKPPNSVPCPTVADFDDEIANTTERTPPSTAILYLSVVQKIFL